MLLEFLRHVECQTMYLVGDIVDGWELSSSRVYWPQSHSDVLQKLLKRARKGTRIVYTPGNHDESLRDFIADSTIELGENVTIVDEALHTTVDGRRLLVLHGDRCDLTPHIRSDLTYQAKSLLYRAYQAFNRVVKRARKTFGLPYWSLASSVNSSVGAAARLISNYEEALAQEAVEQQVHGVVCGHIHHAALKEINSVTYANCGDWVDSCTAIAEHADGRLEVLRWLDLRERFTLPAHPIKEPKSAIVADFLEALREQQAATEQKSLVR